MRMLHNLHKPFTACCTIAALLFVGCSDYEDVYQELTNNESSLVVRLSIGADVAPSSRAETLPRPNGGENGDGRELGCHHENDIKNITVFYYRSDEDKDINSSANTLVSKLAYIPDVDFYPTKTDAQSHPIYGDPSKDEDHSIHKDYSVFTKDVPISTSQMVPENYIYTEGDQYIIVANMGDFMGLQKSITLGELRNYLVNNAWKTNSAINAAGYTDFVMSNERKSTFLGGNGTFTDPHRIAVDIERVAARLDFCVDGSKNEDGQLKYEVNDNATEIGSLYLTHVRPFNVMQQPTYLIKRLGYDDAHLTYLQDEMAYDLYEGVDSEFPYVVEPHTWQKPTFGNANNATLLNWYGETRYSAAHTAVNNSDDSSWFTENYKVHQKQQNDEIGIDGFTTGTSHIGDDLCNDVYVLDYANENTMTPSTSIGQVITGYLLRGIYVPKVVYAGVDDDGNAVFPITAVAKGSSFCRFRPMAAEYDESQAVYFTTEALANAYKKKATVPGVVESYPGGVCYYLAYLRHDNPGSVNDGASPYVTPMEFGIVRNNIYRLKVSFTGPGYSTLPETPPAEPLGIKPYIFVRKWYQIEHPEIVI